MKHTLAFSLSLLLSLLSLACASPPAPTSSTGQVVDAPVIETIESVEHSNTMNTIEGFTYLQADGNRYVTGSTNLPESRYIDVELPARPLWLAGIPFEGGVVWAAGLADDQILFFESHGDEITAVGEPQTGGQQPFSIVLDINADNAAGAQTIPAQPWRAFQATAGVSFDPFGVEPLPDARVLTDGEQRFLLLTNPTERYGHGVLGDAIEAAGIALIDLSDSNSPQITKIDIPDPRVIEGVMPIWADLNGDGQREIIVTLSDSNDGAQLVVFNESGNQIATGPAIGRGNRWRNQMAVAPFGVNGEIELADVRTPHLNGLVEFFTLEEDALERTAQLEGYTSHVYGSPNLDMGAAGDFAELGRAQLLLPTLDRTHIAILARTNNTDNGITELWRATLPGRLTTNVAAVTNQNGHIEVAVGTDANVLRIWTAEN